MGAFSQATQPTPTVYDTPAEVIVEKGNPLTPQETFQKGMPIAMQYTDLPAGHNFVTLAKDFLKPTEGFTLGPGQKRYNARGDVVAEGPEKEAKPVNMPPWYDALGASYFPDYSTNVESQKKWATMFSEKMKTPEGQKELMGLAGKISAGTATPFYMVAQTSEGFVPFSARTGQLGEPTGVGKTLPSEMVTQQQQIGTLQETLSRVKQTYDPSYVGFVSGRLGKIGEKTIGVGERQSKFYSDLAQLRNTLIYLYSGKQINESEYKRLTEQLPMENMPESTFKARMENFELTLMSIMENRKTAMGGYGTNVQNPKVTPANPTGIVVPPPTRYRFTANGGLEEIK